MHMETKHLIVAIAAVSVLICLISIFATGMDGGILDSNPFAGNSKGQVDSDDLTIQFLHIQQVKKAQTEDGNDTGARYNLKFKVESNLDSMKMYDAKVTCFNANGDVIDTASSHIIRGGTNKIPLNCGSDIKKAELVVRDDSGKEVFRDTTEEIKLLER